MIFNFVIFVVSFKNWFVTAPLAHL